MDGEVQYRYSLNSHMNYTAIFVGTCLNSIRATPYVFRGDPKLPADKVVIKENFRGCQL
jgi:hypothetical protein